MNELKRHVIEKHYIRDRYFFKDSSINEIEKQRSSKEYAAYNHYEYDKEKTSKWLRKFGVKDNKKDLIIYFGFGNIIADCLVSISNCTTQLATAHENAHNVFMQYMNYKELIKNGTFSWSDYIVREKMKSLKKSWIDASNEVQRRKSMLWQASLISSRFIDWYIATNEKIAESEKKIEELENEIKTLKGEV